MGCKCAEGKVTVYNDKGEETGEIETGLGVHSCSYIAQRNALIPWAVEIADQKYPPEEKIQKGKTVWVRDPQWSVIFSAAMEKLARKNIRGDSENGNRD